MLTVTDIHTRYGQAEVLFGVSFQVARGEIVSILGRNGAGKSTTLKSIIGLTPPAAGSVDFAGQELVGLPPHRICRLGLGYVPEERRIFAELSVAENLEVGRRAAGEGVAAWTPERLYALFPNLAASRTRRGGEISGGEQQMLTIARTLMGNPRLILLDEPWTGLAPRIAEQLAEAIRDLKQQGLTVLLSEQNLRFAAMVADRALILESGSLRWSGTAEALARDAETTRALLSV
jgi:branched-chain amino acid transport system ATP-binding protein